MQRNHIYKLFGLIIFFPIIHACATKNPNITTYSELKLVSDKPVKITRLGQTRIPFDCLIPQHLTLRLSDEFTLIAITNHKDWLAFARLIHFPEQHVKHDLHRGMIVGIVAEVGEAINDKWPIHIESASIKSGQGNLVFLFSSGYFHPIITDGYLELAYIPDLQEIRLVQINQRRFLLKPEKNQF